MVDLQELQSQVRARLTELLALLERVDDKSWSKAVRAQLSQPELDIGVIRGWYGTMGTLTDLVIMESNGHRVTDQEERAANAELNRLRDSIARLLEELLPPRRG